MRKREIKSSIRYETCEQLHHAAGIAHLHDASEQTVTPSIRIFYQATGSKETLSI